MKHKYETDLRAMVDQIGSEESESRQALEQISRIESRISLKDQQIESLTTGIENNQKYYTHRIQVLQDQYAEAQTDAESAREANSAC